MFLTNVNWWAAIPEILIHYEGAEFRNLHISNHPGDFDQVEGASF